MKTINLYTVNDFEVVYSVVHLGGGTRPPLVKSGPPLETIASKLKILYSLQSP